MLNSTIDFRSCGQEIDSGNGIRSMINEFAVSARENSKADRLRFGVFLVADINCIVPLLDALQDHINGFIRERWSFPK
jgi:hypothetical protein